MSMSVRFIKGGDDGGVRPCRDEEEGRLHNETKDNGGRLCREWSDGHHNIDVWKPAMKSKNEIQLGHDPHKHE